MSQKQKTDKPNTATPKSNVLPITGRIIVRRNEARRRSLLAQDNPHCHIIGDDFAMLTHDSMRGVYAVETHTDEKTAKDAISRVIAPVLKNSSVIVERVAITDDHNGTSYYFLTLTNDKGESRKAVFTARKFKDGSFINQLAGHTVAIAIKKHWDRLPEFIEELTQAQKPAPLRQTAKRVYGWHQLTSGDYVFLLENGCETKDGFVDATAAPLFLDTDGSFGYTGAPADKPTNDVMRLLLTKLNPHPSFDAILFALIGTASHISFIESSGVAPTVLEAFAPMRTGKSGVYDFAVHLFTQSIPPPGTGEWQLPPVFNDSEDTAKGQGHLRAMFRNMLFQLPDLKAMDETTDVKNDNRIKTNEAYGDALSAGITSSIDQIARSRKARAGAPVRTGEEDFAANSIRRKKGSAEFRANSFLWPKGEECERDSCGCGLARNEDGYIQSDENVSREIAKRRVEIYVWGAAYRRWQMQMTAEQRQVIYKDCLAEAEKFVFKNWHIKEDGGKHSGFAIYILAGVLLWLAFLRAQHPASFQIEWFDACIDAYLENRLARTQWILEQTKGNRVMTFSEFVLDAVRSLLLNGDYYITDNTGEALENRDNLPVSLIDFGYAPNGNSFYRPKKFILGYLSKSGDFISFHSEDFYRVLLTRGRETGQQIPLKNTAWEILCGGAVAIRPKSGGHRFSTRIGKKYAECIRIPVSSIWDIDNHNTEGSEEE